MQIVWNSAINGMLKTSDFSDVLHPASLPSHVGSFGNILQQAVTNLQETEEDSSSKVKGLLSGDGTDIHTALIATQKASLSFDLALAVRNKALGAYQQVMSMQF